MKYILVFSSINQVYLQVTKSSNLINKPAIIKGALKGKNRSKKVQVILTFLQMFE